MTSRPMVRPEDIDSIDLASPRLYAENELDEVWRHLRTHRPVYWHPPRADRPGFWVISRYADVNKVYQDKAHFTTENGNALATLLTGGDSASGTMLAVTDGVRHHQIRNVLNKGFSKRTLNLIAHSLQQSVDRLLLAALDKGECDAAHDISANVPLGAICDLLEIPEADRTFLLSQTAHAWSSDYADAPPEDNWVAKNEILLYFSKLCRERKGSANDDMVSLLANCRIDDQPLNSVELMANCYGLMIGGDETGRHAITGAILALIEHPDQWRALKNGDVDLDTATEEVLRWTVPSLHGGRTATGDVVVGGEQIKAGDVVSVWIYSANRDETVFDQPDRFDLARTPNKHFTFAYGTHYCLGHHLGRMEVYAVLDGLRRLVTDLEQIGEEKWIYSSILHGMSSLPVRLTA
ncbi:cytochrome P450 [Streptomyces camelliae]|uniref:Cytochrome P450 n=1 Tax=Streptomyces camelliae TaxID=3004093 RepID=A0ABY7P5Y0_9ACTN|nr:cytochrome P450 [Streptomyces sp. HUAS 2-6]WBO64738.1 cytochrome P450 [Streptomyces sp. HUAS 2-6]